MSTTCMEASCKERERFILESLREELPQWAKRLESTMEHSVVASDHNLGHLEEALLEETKAIQRQILEEAAQKKADATPPRCPQCGRPLSRLSTDHPRSFETRFGSIIVKRTRGYCKRCQRWRFPADAALGLADTAGYSPSVQEMAALGVSKMPVADAEAVIERLAGVKIPRATLDREARRQGENAQRLRQQMDQQVQTPEGAAKVSREVQLELPLEPFTLVLMIDAWNIRERDDWGQTQRQRRRGEEPKRWHWVYGATVFRLNDRVETAGGRRMLVSRGYAVTRQGIDALRQQLYAEAIRRGLLQAKKVLIIADGAVWIWNLVADRFADADQRLDLYHAKQHLWTVAKELHGEGTAEAAQWVKPLLKQLESGQAPKVVRGLEEVLTTVDKKSTPVVEREINYLRNNLHRMDYRQAKKNNEPCGSGAVESLCRQYQCRFKRVGQYWSSRGDESLMSLETFWRNGRWNQLFPHAGNFNPSKN